MADKRPDRRMPSKKAIVDYWQRRLRTQMPEVYELVCEATFDFPDWGTTCWSCGRESINLERAHLLGRYLGGLDTPANLVMLCNLCHKDQPDHDRNSAIIWLRKRAHVAMHHVTFLGMLPFFMTMSPAEFVSHGHGVALERNASHRAWWFSLSNAEQIDAMRGMVEQQRQAHESARNAWADYEPSAIYAQSGEIA